VVILAAAMSSLSSAINKVASVLYGPFYLPLAPNKEPLSSLTLGLCVVNWLMCPSALHANSILVLVEPEWFYLHLGRS